MSGDGTSIDEAREDIRAKLEAYPLGIRIRVLASMLDRYSLELDAEPARPVPARPVESRSGKPLTTRQRQVAVWIRDYIQTNRASPSMREIGRAFGITSTNGVNDMLIRLENKGLISRPKDLRARGIRYIGDAA